MKSAEYLKTLSGKSGDELQQELVALRKEQFNLRMQRATGQMNQHHLMGQVRKNIARVKSVQSAQRAVK
ncbi:50S ribosomal protein L29 [Polycyclovorans algicola]|uniref:50S ribosomal protein L29 n=1 Tax=Polycyclovorans algicola TaxID=616992 RepID=UPI0004A7828C|nr:50S ribosomal protein L29 [Polycyclovorans algicola]